MVQSSAPGKIILFGEHASSRDRPAIIFAVNSRLQARLSKANEGSNEILLTSKDLGVVKARYPSKKLDLVSKAIEYFYEETGCSKEPLELVISSNIKPGFGSSAAAIVATLGAFNGFYKTNLSEEELLRLGLKANFAIKGYGSGLDIATAVFGGLIWYHKGRGVEKLLQDNLDFVIGNTGIKAPSGPIVKAVKEFEKKNPKEARTIFDEIEQIVREAKKAIQTTKKEKVGELMNRNQELLRKLNVSSAILEELISAALKGGALGAKLSGAGVGDNMVALVDQERRESVITALNKTKGKGLEEVTIDPKGLVVKA